MKVADTNLEIPYNVSSYMREEYDDKHPSHPLLKQMTLSGRLGKKTGKGFYDYKKKQ